LGYNWTEEQVEKTEIECEVLDKNGAVVRNEKGRKITVKVPAIKVKTTNKHVPAEPVCIFFWLTNRARSDWQHIRVNKVEGKLDGPQQVTNNYFDLSELPEKELEYIADVIDRATKEREEKQRQINRSNGASGTA
jgi:hypothetical protein